MLKEDLMEEKRGSAKSDFQSEKGSIELVELNYIEDTKALDATIERLEGSKKYNKVLLVQGMISMFACAFNMFSLGFLNTLPKFHCMVEGNSVLLPETEACKIIDQCSVDYFYEGWIKHYDMICDNRSARVFYISLIFVINAGVFFVLQTMADIFGRNLVLKLATLVASIGTFLIYYVDSYGAKIVIFGMVTGTNSVFQMMFTLGLKEAAHSSSEYNVYMNAILNIAYNIGPTFVALLAFLFPVYWELSLVGSIVVVLGTLGNFFVYNETPLFLYKKKKGREFINKLFLLSKINSVITSKKSILGHIISDEIEFRNKQKLVIPEEGIKQAVVETTSEEQKKPKQDQPNLIWVTVVLCYWCASLYLVNYGTVISIDKSGMDNLYANSVILGISSLLGYAVSIKFPKNVKRIYTISLIILTLLLFSVIILLLDFFATSSSSVKFLKSALTVGLMPILVSMGFSVMYLYLPDVYPITLRGFGIGCVICMGKLLGGACSAYVASFMNQFNLNPIAGCAIPGLFLLVLLRTVPES